MLFYYITSILAMYRIAGMFGRVNVWRIAISKVVGKKV